MRLKGFIFLLVSIGVLFSVGFYVEKNYEWLNINSESIPYSTYVNYERKIQSFEDIKVYFTVSGNKKDLLIFKLVDSKGSTILEKTTKNIREILELKKGNYSIIVNGDVSNKRRLKLKLIYPKSKMNFSNKILN